MDDPRADGELEFHMVKSSNFKVLHVDGIFGGPSPSGQYLHIAVYSERNPLPTKLIYKVSKGVLGEEVFERRESKSGIFREVEADLVMSLDVAIAFKDWLEDKIKSMQKINQASGAAIDGDR